MTPQHSLPPFVTQPQIGGFDLVSVGVTLAAIAGWLPSIATVVTIVWLGIRIWETDTFVGARHRRRLKKAGRPNTGTRKRLAKRASRKPTPRKPKKRG